MKYKNLLFLAAILGVFAVLCEPTFADDYRQADLSKMDLINFGSYGSVSQLIMAIMSFLAKAIVFAAVIGFMIGGGFLVFSAGDEGMLSRGKDIMIASVIGLIVTLLAYAIVEVVRNLIYGIN